MPNYTDNLGLQIFAEGESPWDHGPDMETLDVEVTLKRARAPDSSLETPKEGAMFLDTSTGEIYVADGSSWGTPRWNLGNIGTGGDGSGGWTQSWWTASESGNVASVGDSIWVDTSGGNVTVTLPAPAQSARVRVKHATDGGTGNNCFVSPNGTETIDSSSSDYPVPDNAGYEFESDGAEWETF